MLLVNDSEVQEKDVLCGRDRYIHAHKGNQQFRHLIALHRQWYQGAKHRDNKTSITLEIIGTVRKYGGRFLKQENGRWYEVDQTHVHENGFTSFAQCQGSKSTQSYQAQAQERRGRRDGDRDG